MAAHLERAEELLRQGRLDLAEAELRRALASDGQNGRLLALLALCLVDRDDLDGAIAGGRKAVLHAPHDALAHYALAYSLFQRERGNEALAACQELLKLDPHNPDYAALHGQILFQLQRWSDALEAAARGLELAPEHPGCRRLKGLAEAKLAPPPAEVLLMFDDPRSNTEQAARLMEQGQLEQAIGKYVVAWHRDRGYLPARQGLVAACAGRNLLYRWLLTALSTLAGLGNPLLLATVLAGGAAAVGGLLLERRLAFLADWGLPLLYAYSGLLALLGAAEPLFFWALTCSRRGRLAVSPAQRAALKLGAVFLPPAVAAFVLAPFFSEWWVYYFVGLGFVLLASLTWNAFRCRPGFPRAMMAAYAVSILLVVVGCFTFALLVHFLYPDLLPLMRWICAWASGGMFLGALFSPVVAVTLDPLGSGFKPELQPPASAKPVAV